MVCVAVDIEVRCRVKLVLSEQRAWAPKDPGMYIQYVGFETAPTLRIYAFHVMDGQDAGRDFTVTVQADAFGPNRLKLQDGPGICFARLGQELRGEAQDTRAETHLMIGERDIKEYLGHNPPPKVHGNKEE
jgi:hypothetical protein